MMDITTIPESLQGQSVTVLGAARSGLAAARLLARKGAQVLLSDSAEPEISPALRTELNASGVTLETGGHSPRALAADLAIISPGIPGTTRIVQELEKRKIPLISEVELACWFSADATIIGVTGSNGKTTTTSLLGTLFEGSRFDSYCGGNIGIPFSDLILAAEHSNHPQKVFILELSSFQLERIVHFHPHVALILNVTDDHMDRYQNDILLYLEAKLNIIKNQDKNDYYIHNADDALLRQHIPSHCRPIPFGIHSDAETLLRLQNDTIYLADGSPLIDTEQLQILGMHNIYNVLAAATAALLGGLTRERIAARLPEFRSIEHRLEFVAEIGSVQYYNDSKATNVDSVRFALKSFTQPVIVILGGKDKDSDFSLLIPALRKHARDAILIGQATDKLRNSLSGVLPLHEVDSLEAAVDLGQRLATPGDIVLLSPACASFDMFRNYEQRGRMFKAAVHKLAQDTES